jgi:RimJ/RimL family protein N-acetyltransferase
MDSVTLIGKNVRLLPIRYESIRYLYEWTIDVENAMLWTNKREIPPYEQYVQEIEWRLKNNILTQLMIHKADEDSPIGTIYAYDSNTSDGYTFVTIYLVPSCTRIGYGTEASMLFTDYLFAYMPLRKIYTDVYGYNDRSLHVIRAAGLIEEGCFRQHRWFNGRYADLYRFALYAKDWPEIRSRYLDAMSD